MIDTATRKIVTQLTDEKGRAVQSEKMIEVHRQGEKVLRLGNQFGINGVKNRVASNS